MLFWLNNDFVSNIFVGTDGKLHKVQGGADSVLPFSSKNIPVVLQDTNAAISIISNQSYEYFLWLGAYYSHRGGASGEAVISNTTNATFKELGGGLDGNGYGTVHLYLIQRTIPNSNITITSKSCDKCTLIGIS